MDADERCAHASETARAYVVDDIATGQHVDRRNMILRAALRAHDVTGCRCDRKYVMSCPQLVHHILEQGDTVIR